MIWEIDESTKPVEGLDAAGRPVPAYAASLGLIAAPFGRRFAATAVEVGVVLVLALPMLLGALPIALANLSAMDAAPVALNGSDLLWFVVFAAATSVLTTVFVIVQMTLHGRRGVTLGKAIFGIRSVNVRTLERPGFWRGAVVRYLLMWASFLVPFFGPLLVVCLSPLFDSEHRGRGWPDHAGATWFVDIRNGLNPYDAKRMRIARKTVATNLLDEKTPLPSLATSSTRALPPATLRRREATAVCSAHIVLNLRPRRLNHRSMLQPMAYLSRLLKHRLVHRRHRRPPRPRYPVPTLSRRHCNPAASQAKREMPAA